jgi:hypothetical protein
LRGLLGRRKLIRQTKRERVFKNRRRELLKQGENGEMPSIHCVAQSA